MQAEQVRPQPVFSQTCSRVRPPSRMRRTTSSKLISAHSHRVMVRNSGNEDPSNTLYAPFVGHHDIENGFHFQPCRPGSGGAPRGSGPRRGYNAGMPEALDIICPCCEAVLKVDPETGSVVWVDKKKPKARSFDDLVSRVGSRRSLIDKKFARSVQETRHASEILDKKFEEARKRAAADPDKRPPNPFDFE